jgi:hypothetical protein
MSTTVFVQAKVWSFPTQSGRTGYIWAENSYDKKDGPGFGRSAKHNWSVTALGYREQILARIFAMAESIADQMLKVRHAAAENFIAAMIKQLNSPLQLNTTKLELKNSAHSFYAAINDGNRAGVQAQLVAAGKQALAQAVAASPRDGGADSIPVDLFTDLDLVRALTGPTGVTSVWRVIPNVSSNDIFSGRAGLAPDVDKRLYRGKIEINLMETGLSDDGPLRALAVDGEFAGLGLNFCLEQQLIRLCSAREIEHPGYYKVVLGQFREALKTPLQTLPESTVFQVDASCATEYMRGKAEWISEAITKVKSPTFTITLGQAKAALAAAQFSGDGHMPYRLQLILGDTDITKLRLDDAETTDDDEGEAFEPAPAHCP